MQWDITDTVISIHALLAESDRRHRRLHPVPYQDFYPRSPCGERQQYKASSVLKPLFLSTLSLRRATVTVLGIQHRVGISIHALLAESDKRVITRNTLHELFLSTLSLRRATSFMLYDTSSLIFLSTLSLRRATVAPVLEAGGSRYFYPRSPCGERRLLMCFWPSGLLFLSTLSLRRATRATPAESIPIGFLSTLSLRRATVSYSPTDETINFYPRSPCGERLQQAITAEQTARISIHALLAESDCDGPFHR